ncbi:hypothetical protein [Pseudomonas serbica]
MTFLQDSEIIMEDNASPTVVYDDEHIRVIWTSGQSSYVLVTFAPMTSLVDGIRFFCDVPVQKLGINCLGFMPKKPNWYPTKSMTQAVAASSAILARFPEVISYGGSMGGYGAIKYSALLGATSVIALCPQWSIDISECEGNHPGFQSWYDPSMKGMAVRPVDVGGKVYVFYDPAHERDSFHATQLLSHCNGAESVFVRSVAHDVISVMAGTSNLECMINHIRREENEALRIFVGKIRKTHPIRVRELCRRLLEKHPSLLNAIMKSPNNLSALSEDDVAVIDSELLNYFSLRNMSCEAVSVIDRLVLLRICHFRKDLLRSYRMAMIGGQGFRSNEIVTHHGSIVVYNALSGKLVHLHKNTFSGSAILFPVFLKRYANNMLMCVTVQGRDFRVQISRKSQVRLGPDDGPDLELKTLIKGEEKDGVLALSHFGFYLTARRDGTIAYNRKAVLDWEKFKYAT